jgi:hypothetical protein
MKKENNNYGYSSPCVELFAMACEQAVMAGSAAPVSGASNEKFEEGDSYDGGWM